MISATIREIAIILLALQTLIVNILLGVLIWQIYRMVKMLQTEIKPMIEDTQETLAQCVVQPISWAKAWSIRWCVAPGQQPACAPPYGRSRPILARVVTRHVRHPPHPPQFRHPRRRPRRRDVSL